MNEQTRYNQNRWETLAQARYFLFTTICTSRRCGCRGLAGGGDTVLPAGHAGGRQVPIIFAGQWQNGRQSAGVRAARCPSDGV